DLEQRLVQAKAALAAPEAIRLGTAVGLHSFVLAANNLPCPLLTRGQLAELSEIALIDTSRHQSERTTEYIHYSLAHLAQARSDWPTMRKYLEQALQLKPDPQTATLIAWSWVLQDDL